MPRPSKQKKAAQLRVQNAQVHQEASVSQDLPTQLEAAHARVNVLESQLEQQAKINERLTSELAASQSLASRLQSSLKKVEDKAKFQSHDLCMQCQKAKRAVDKQGSLESQMKLLKLAEKAKSDQILLESENSTKAIDSLLKVN